MTTERSLLGYIIFNVNYSSNKAYFLAETTIIGKQEKLQDNQ